MKNSINVLSKKEGFFVNGGSFLSTAIYIIKVGVAIKTIIDAADIIFKSPAPTETSK